MTIPVKESYRLDLKDAHVSKLRRMMAAMEIVHQVKELDPLKLELQTATDEMLGLIGAATLRVSYFRC